MSIEFEVGNAKQHSYIAVNQAFEDGHLYKASRIIREALSDSDGLDPMLINSATKLADRYLLEGDYTSAASLLRAAIEAKTKMLGTDHNDVVELRKKLALTLWETGGLTPVLLPST